MKQKEMKGVTVPLLDELSVKTYFEAYKDDIKLKQYLPASLPKGR